VPGAKLEHTGTAEAVSAAPSIRQVLVTRRMLICVFTGFTSGLPLYVLITLVPAWLRSEGVQLAAIGLFSLIQFPYTWKFVWSPLMDRYGVPLLGRRRGWMLITQCALLAAIACTGMFAPASSLRWIALMAALTALLSASQDIVLDAYRREILRDEELGLGTAVHVNAYKIAGLIPGSLALVLADHFPWSSVFAMTALFMLPGVAMTLVVREPVVPAGAPRTLRAAIVEPFVDFISRSGWGQALLVLAFIFLFKLGDSMATALATPFYIDMGFTKSEIGLIAKNAGLWPSVIGGLLGGLWMVKLGINRALWLFGAAQALSILGFAALSQMPHDRVALAAAIGAEALGVGLGTAAFTAFIARATNPRYTATQYALFTSLAAVPRTLINATTGWIVQLMGWFDFFLLCTVLAIPGMVLLWWVAPWSQDSAPAHSK
jgi:MFS transporter, PAT family, beta-lactamase induction signal transducer AmpG